MQVVQVVPRIANRSSGPSISVPSLCLGLSQAGLDVELLTLEPPPENRIFENLTQFPTLPLLERLGVSPQLKKALKVRGKQVDIIHNNSLWMMPNIYPFAATKNQRAKLVVSPRGTLSNYALNRASFRKKIVWKLGQRDALLQADCLHATSEEECEAARAIGYQGPIAVIPNGVQCPSEVRPANENGRRTLLFLARIHPTKGVDLLLRAWANLEAQFPEWDLKIAGPTGHDYATKMQQLAAELKVKRAEFVGELRDQAKSDAYFDSQLYVLPTHTENFGVSIAEALAHGTPAIVFEGAPWKGLNEKQAGWWIPENATTLETTLQEALQMSAAQLADKGNAGREWMLSEFDWSEIGVSMAKVYQWLCDGGEKPTCVQVK